MTTRRHVIKIRRLKGWRKEERSPAQNEVLLTLDSAQTHRQSHQRLILSPSLWWSFFFFFLGTTLLRWSPSNTSKWLHTNRHRSIPTNWGLNWWASVALSRRDCRLLSFSSSSLAIAQYSSTGHRSVPTTSSSSTVNRWWWWSPSEMGNKCKRGKRK